MKRGELISLETLFALKEKCQQSKTVTVDADTLLAVLDEITMVRWKQQVRQEFNTVCQARAVLLEEIANAE